MEQEGLIESPTRRLTQKPRLFGVTAIKKGFIKKAQLFRVLNIQAVEDRLGKQHRLIGMILYDEGFITLRQINEVHKSLPRPLYEV